MEFQYQVTVTNMVKALFWTRLKRLCRVRTFSRAHANFMIEHFNDFEHLGSGLVMVEGMAMTRTNIVVNDPSKDVLPYHVKAVPLHFVNDLIKMSYSLGQKPLPHSSHQQTFAT